ncbi:MAG: cysteine synthase A [Chloroflexi bacterium]|nr:cysteine synthase A [Chloroflexota bacterium]
MTTPDWGARARIYDSVLDTAGHTPLVRLRRVVPEGITLLAKLEYHGPSGSVKDRILPHIVRSAIKRGDLRPGMSIIEGTTGNTGIATAMVGAALGYPVVIVMPEGMSRERRDVIRAYGARLVLTPGAESDVDLVLEQVAELMARSPGTYWRVGQFDNRDNSAAHQASTGPELWEQAGRDVDAFIASQGTGGTLTGIGRYLKSQRASTLVYAVEPSECAILSGGPWGAHRIEGIGDGFVPAVLELDVLDGVVQVTSDESIAMARRLAREEGIFCGISSGCNVAAAIKLAQALPKLKRIATIVNDNGLRYLSTELLGEPEHPAEIPDRPHEIGSEMRRQINAAKLHVIA